MKFIHTADIHLDSPLRGLSQREGAPEETIRGATRRALEAIVNLAIDREVDFVLIAGDLYDGDWPDFSTGLFFNKQMNRLSQEKIPVYLITGNHDAESKITKSLKPPGNVHIFSTKSPESCQVNDLPVMIHGQGFATQHVQEDLSASYPAPVQDRFNIGLLHTSLAGDPNHDVYAPCSLDDLVAKGYQYWALGHIHLRAIHHENPHVVYSGNPQGRHINEQGARGCYLVEVDEDLEVSTMEFVATDTVRWESVEVEVPENCSEQDALHALIRDTIQTASEDSEERLLALRLVLTGQTRLHDRLHAEQSRWLAECISIAAELNEDLIWIERLKIKTQPAYDVDELAERDELTALVLEALQGFDPGEACPESVSDLCDRLKGIPAPNHLEIFEHKSDAEIFKKEISSIVLNSIALNSND